jgi:hypothetical protein
LTGSHSQRIRPKILLVIFLLLLKFLFKRYHRNLASLWYVDNRFNRESIADTQVLVDLYDPSVDVAATKNDSTNTTATWPAILAQADVALNDLRAELERQETLERTLSQSAQKA